MQALLDIVLPVFLLIGVGYGAFRLGVLPGDVVGRLSPLVFNVLMGPLLFRTMARSELGRIDLGPTVAYYAASLVLFGGVFALQTGLRGVARSPAIVHSLTATFSNTAMIGIPIVSLAFGDSGLQVLLPIIALHALVMLTLATVVLEFDLARGGPTADAGSSARVAGSSASAPGSSARAALLRAVRQSVIHPVVLPILMGLAWHRLGLSLPGPVDRTLELLAGAGPTMSLLMLGGSLGRFGLRAHWRGALALSAAKSFLHPALAFAIGAFALKLTGLPLAVSTVCAAMPIGGNVYLFSQRYGIEVGRVSAAVALSTLLSIGSITALLSWLR